jgi:hypothetical protein
VRVKKLNVRLQTVILDGQTQQIIHGGKKSGSTNEGTRYSVRSRKSSSQEREARNKEEKGSGGTKMIIGTKIK